MATTRAPVSGPMLIRSDKAMLGGAIGMITFAGVAHYAGWNSVLAFVVSAAAV